MTRILTAAMALILVAGCKGKEEEETPQTLTEAGEEVAGLYAVTEVLENLDGCGSPGESVLATYGATHLGVEPSSFFGIPFLTLVPCNGLEDCRAELDIDLNFAAWGLEDFEGSTFTGTAVSTIGTSEGCSGVITELEAVFDGDTLVFTERRTEVSDFAPDAEGFCATEGAEAVADDFECSSIATVQASFEQTL